MAYSKQTWMNDDPATPLSAERLGHIEDGIGDVHADVDGLAFADIAGTATAAQIPTLTIAKVTGLQAAIDAKAATTALTSGLAGKADTSHTHTVAQVTGLQAILDDLETRLAAVEGA